MANIAIFASGNGTNAENIIRYFADNNIIKIAAVFSNKEKAPVLEKAKNLQVPAFYFKREDFSNGYPILEILHKLHIDGICLAGFLCMVSPVLLKAFPKRIINIHPSLLPKFGGKGMYGLNVHRKVIENAEIMPKPQRKFGEFQPAAACAAESDRLFFVAHGVGFALFIFDQPFEGRFIHHDSPLA